MSPTTILHGRHRLHLYLGSLAFALWTGWLIFVLLSSGASGPTGRVGGDFPAFWGAGRLILEGQADQLWDWEAQQIAQRGAFPEPGSIVPYPYAPVFALLFAPLAVLPYQLAYVIYTLAMAASTLLAVVGLIKLLPSLAAWRGPLIFAAMGFPPLFRASTQGQNTAAVLCLLVWIFVALKEERSMLGGVLLGLLWFKATYAAPLTGLLLLDRRFRALGWAGAVVLAGWLVSAALAGPRWVERWLLGAAEVQQFNLEFQRGDAVSLVETAWETLPGRWGIGVAGSLLVILAGLTIVLWRRADEHGARLAVVAMMALLLAPHANWYDLGLMVAPLAFLASRLGRSALAASILVPFALTVPMLVDARMGGLWVAFTVVYAGLVARQAGFLDTAPATPPPQRP